MGATTRLVWSAPSWSTNVFFVGFKLKRNARNRGIRDLHSIPGRVLQDSARWLHVLRKGHCHNVPTVNLRFVQALVRD
jgi:hypothetical protein